MRLGLCCLFIKAPIRFRTTTASYLARLKGRGEDPHAYLAEIVLSNAENLLLAVNYCAAHGIGSFRINSQIFPVYTHPTEGYRLELLPNRKEILEELEKVRAFCREHNIRLTFHPDQFVVLNSPDPDVVARSIQDLEYHALAAGLVGADVINIHGGGGYGDKPSALARFAENFHKLSPEARALLTVENDDKVYTPSELLPLCAELGIPLVYDVHHHRCLPDALTVESATEQALASWNREPLFHVSSPKDGWKGPKPEQHADFIDPEDLPECWKKIHPLTIEVEAKAKEAAVDALRTALLKKHWKLE